MRIHKFETHYRLPESVMAERQRLDQIRTMVLDGALELALERVGLPEDGELCIRRVSVPVRLRLTGTDASLAVLWSVALAEEIERELHSGRSSNAVFYRSRRQALIDMAISIARGDVSRAWAWRQLGLWRASEPTSESEAVFELTQALCAVSSMVIAVLCALSELQLLARVLRRMTGKQFEALAYAALSKAGATHLVDGADHAPTSRALRDTMRVLNSSRILAAVTASRLLVNETDEVCRAAAALIVLEAEPVLLRAATAKELIALIASALRSARSEVGGALLEQAEIDSESLAEQMRVDDEGPSARKAREYDERSLSEQTAGGEVDRELEMAIEPEAERDEEMAKVPDLQKRAFTRFGGLLFLLGVFEDLELAEEILDNAALGARPFRWVIHQLALRLVAAKPDDAAVLAFSGLLPGAAPPSDDQPPPDEIEEGAIQELAARIVERLRLLLDWREEQTAQLLEFISHRQAEIVGDPGWIDVKLLLDEASVEIRRAGLDLNPGYLPWLGVVVRFVYE
ncbi:MAG TPA: hypothetical protein VKA70_11665 [Blastocatellia bacterium]|nr:hypothetical protein [Blastocatellia bacterium]